MKREGKDETQAAPDKPPVVLTAEMVLRVVKRYWPDAADADIRPALCALADGQTVCVPAPDLAAVRGEVEVLRERIAGALDVLQAIASGDVLFSAPNAAPGKELRFSDIRDALALLTRLTEGEK